MAEGKRYYWLRLKEDFFASKRIKKLRNMAGGDTYVIIYLKMQLLALKTDGVLRWSGLEENFADELALDLDEKPDDVSVTLMYLLNTGLAETSDNITYFFPWVIENTGSETASAQRSREYRSKQKMLQCNSNATQLQQKPNVEKEIEKDKELEIEKEIEIEREDDRACAIPTLEEVKAFSQERQSNVDPLRFWSYYDIAGWKDQKGEPIRNWKLKFMAWEKTEPERRPLNKNIKPSTDPDKYPAVTPEEIWKRVAQI